MKQRVIAVGPAEDGEKGGLVVYFGEPGTKGGKEVVEGRKYAMTREELLEDTRSEADVYLRILQRVLKGDGEQGAYPLGGLPAKTETEWVQMIGEAKERPVLPPTEWAFARRVLEGGGSVNIIG